MRTKLLLIPMLLGATPALAQAPAAPAPDTAQIQRVLNDPAMADRLANVMQAMTKGIRHLCRQQRAKRFFPHH